MPSTKKIFSIIFLIVFSLAIAGGGIYFLTQQSAQLPSEKTQRETPPTIGDDWPKNITYKISNGQESKEYKFGAIIASSTVFSALRLLGERENFPVIYKDYPEMGVLVESIGGVASGTENKYWQYWVNDVLGDVASDKKTLKAGDRVEWKFDIAPAF